MTSFVLDGELFFTGVITELAKHRARANSFSSASDTTESTLKQRVGWLSTELCPLWGKSRY